MPYSNISRKVNNKLVNQLQFEKYNSFFLQTEGWGEAKFMDITKLLDSVISNFYEDLDIGFIPEKQVYVMNSRSKVLPANYPEIIKHDKLNLIYLCTEDRLWSQYAYQFSHELCHHVLDLDFHFTIDKFGWFEESLCELASLYCLEKMSITWKTNPPYPNWSGYSSELHAYYNSIVTILDNKINLPFDLWLETKLDILFLDRYSRTENRIIALQLIPVFLQNPDAWKAVQYLKLVVVTDEMTLKDFLIEWKNHVPENLKIALSEIVTAMSSRNVF